MNRAPFLTLHHFLAHMATAILLAIVSCCPARCQDAQTFSARLLPETPAPHWGENICLLRSEEMCSGLISADSQLPPDRSSEGRARKTVKRFEADQAGIYSAPFHRVNLKWDALFLAGTGALIATDRQTTGELSRNHIDIGRNISNVGLYGTSAAAGALLLSGLVTHNEHARETGVLSVEALVNTLPIYGGLQLIAGRERPNEGTGNGRFLQNHALGSSFPSGHAMFTWTMASVIAHEYPRPWLKWLAYGTATAVSVSRFGGREHFPSDVLVGTAMGYLIGRHIFKAHCTFGFSKACEARKLEPRD